MIVTLDICFQPIKCIGSQTQAGDPDFRFELDYWLISLCNTYTFESTKSRNFINNFINYLLLNNQSHQLGQIACQNPQLFIHLKLPAIYIYLNDFSIITDVKLYNDWNTVKEICAVTISQFQLVLTCQNTISSSAFYFQLINNNDNKYLLQCEM